MPAEKHIQELFGLYGDLRSPRRLAAEIETLTARYGHFSAQPFERGVGTAIGSLLRRALLTGLEGPAITAIKIEGVDPQFFSIAGVAEDATEIILNLQKIPFRLNASEPKTLKIIKDGPGEVTSIEIEADDDVEILDPTIHIANVDHGGSLRIEMRLKRARGYRRSERNFEEDLEIGYLPIDSMHSPVEKVNYTVEPARFDLKRCDKLSIEIWTNGSVRPEDALAVAATLIKNHMSIFINFEEDEIPPLKSEFSHRRIYSVGPHMKYLEQELPGYGYKFEDLRAELWQQAFHNLKLSSREDLIPTVREVVREESTARNYVTKRYRELIDRKYLTGLSQTEYEELDALTLTLEEMDKPYYEAIVDRLRNLIEQR